MSAGSIEQAADYFSGDDATDRILDHLPRAARAIVATAPAQRVELCTARFRLRELAPSDCDALASLHADREHRAYVLPHQFGSAYIERKLASALLSVHLKCRSLYEFAVVASDTAEFAGTCGLSLRGTLLGAAALGWELRREFSGNGVAVETGNALIRFARGLGLRRVLADCDARNARCISALRKLGMSEVTLRPWTLWAMRRRYRAHLPYARYVLARLPPGNA